MNHLSISSSYSVVGKAARHFAIVWCLLLVWSVAAQVSQNQLSLDQGSFLCQPGVINQSPGKGASITYVLNPDYSLHSINTDDRRQVSRNERFEAKVKLPLVVRPAFKAMLGLKYGLERFHFTDLESSDFPLLKRLSNSELKVAEAAAYFVMPINDKYYTALRMSASYNGDYSEVVNFDRRYALYRVAAVWGVKKRQDLEYGAGLMYSSRYGHSTLVPFAFYNRTFNEHWGLESTLPVSIKARYNFNERLLTLFGTEYSSQRYALAVPEPISNPFLNHTEKAPYVYRNASLDLTSSWYYHLRGWAWLQFKVGYSFNLASEATHISSGTTYNLHSNRKLCGMLTLFFTPPRNYR
jgi:hypothetical protein